MSAGLGSARLDRAGGIPMSDSLGRAVYAFDLDLDIPQSPRPAREAVPAEEEVDLHLAPQALDQRRGRDDEGFADGRVDAAIRHGETHVQVPYLGAEALRGDEQRRGVLHELVSAHVADGVVCQVTVPSGGASPRRAGIGGTTDH